ncbi:hypothetical protein AB3N61_18480 [Leptospira sp. WS58.C1]|uniref:hypothetical protein n=1 Tax=Leptospira cinconiae TaxID=3235173 RepID=UPI00349EFCD6
MFETLSYISNKPRGNIESWFLESKSKFDEFDFLKAPVPFDVELVNQYQNYFPESKKWRELFTHIAWFHGTRCNDQNLFEEGLLPLGRRINTIWDYLYSIVKSDVSEEEWNIFKNHMSGTYAKLYHSKISDPKYWGPYAMLIKDIFFVSESVGNHNYLQIPEIVEDIIFCFSNFRPNVDLKNRYKASTTPCIVKFIAPIDEIDYLNPLLNYLYTEFHNAEHTLDSNTCYDGKGRAIMSEAIISVEYIGR